MFKYFADPVSAKGSVPSGATCACCDMSRGWLCIDIVCTEWLEDLSICPWCVSDGSAAGRWDASFNQLAREEVLPGVREEIERRTPRVSSWQDLLWPVCCHDACVFLGHAQHHQLTVTWPQAGDALRAVYKKGWLGTKSADEFLERFKAECDPGAYVFRCRHCGKMHVEWDCS